MSLRAWPFAAERCSLCGQRIGRGYRRWKLLPIPSRGGVARPVCEQCVPDVEAQERLDVDAALEVDRAVRGFERVQADPPTFRRPRAAA